MEYTSFLEVFLAKKDDPCDDEMIRKVNETVFQMIPYYELWGEYLARSRDYKVACDWVVANISENKIVFERKRYPNFDDKMCQWDPWRCVKSEFHIWKRLINLVNQKKNKKQRKNLKI